MADVRSLLRQQRAARRIEHPFAAYSDAGKLLCTLCRQYLKTESLWDTHLLSQGHRQSLQQRRATGALEAATPPGQGTEGGLASGLCKRKRDSVAGQQEEEDAEARDATRPKRGRTEAAAPGAESPFARDAPRSDTATPTLDRLPSVGSNDSKESTQTPPGLARRTSSATPSHGVELQIPSRPATPAHRDSVASAPGGYFAVQPPPAGGSATPASRQPTPSSSGAAPAAAARPPLADGKPAPPAGAAAAGAVDESEWAAFEADIAAATAPLDEGAVISAPAMTKEDVAAKEAKEAEEASRGERKAQADVDIEDEREEAKRALEDEFDEMRSLQERVHRLKESRATMLKRRSQSQGQETGPARAPGCNGPRNGVSEAAIAGGKRSDDDDDDNGDDGDEDEEDDWASFRFRRG
ncbi:uncharacterized protein UV8b_05284 [Ustilaginoidea virens]|uniref:Coiled-coil domain-containing protein 16 n=1 Tax=Ustilaginoidea virens TaxID=1159556 RepID=A0A8E5HT40_USTVR|nr:uncharacterized protein UV8b_05284 [Ustilaginoidea virens]QUC21043.1 hypothetical protein UV8b_05284 [Ustilaginoidea virens]